MHKSENIHDAAEKRIWSARVLGYYWLLQLPEAALLLVILLLLQAWLEFPAWITWSLVGLWVAKDAALYPLVWRSFDSGYPATMHLLDGEIGVATERIDPTGYVRVRGELWHAELERGAPPIEKDEAVHVKATRDLTLIVAAAHEK